MADVTAYTDQLQQLMPPGAAWPTEADANLTQLLGAIAEEFGRLDARAERLIEEADPRTALELLPDWERVSGLPDTCAGAIAATVPERRSAIVGKITARGGQSIAYLTSLAASLGFPIAITEYRPSRAGMRLGSRVHGIDWAFAFRVDVLPSSGQTAAGGARRLRAGQGRSGERLISFGTPALECVLRRAKPAHTTIIFAYPAVPAAAFFFDFTAS